MVTILKLVKKSRGAKKQEQLNGGADGERATKHDAHHDRVALWRPGHRLDLGYSGVYTLVVPIEST